MVLMRKCGVRLENDSLQTLLRFLLYSKHNEILLQKLIARIYKDKQIKIDHIECIALTSILMKMIRYQNRHLKLATPLYYSPNYLHIFPESIYKVRIVEFGHNICYNLLNNSRHHDHNNHHCLTTSAIMHNNHQ